MCYNIRMSGLPLLFLGSFQAEINGRPLSHFRTKTVQALLIYLTCQPEAHQREQLMTLLWPGMPQTSAQKNLRQSLYLLRQAIPEIEAKNGEGTVPFLLIDRQTIQVNPDGRYHLDLHTFNNLLKQDESHWPQAVALYRGDFLADFYLPYSVPFEEWTNARRADLRHRFLDALTTLTDQALQTGSLAEATQYARRQLEMDNLREIAYRQLMTALARSGQRSEALIQFETCRRFLRDELEVEPSAETQAVYRHLINDEGASPLLTSFTQPPPHSGNSFLPHNLPQRLTSFIGRGKEIGQLQSVLLNAENRLLTLTGAGGTGKSRLSLEVAGTLRDAFPDGIWLVELAPLADPAFVVSAVAAVFELREEGERPLTTIVSDYLRAKQLLLILDNCEHLIEICAYLAQNWLELCPNLTILATSREALGVPGETAVPLLPLAVPNPHQQLTPLETLAEVEAVQLFVERARAALPEFTLTMQNSTAVTEICQRLDGIPLAIELAAAQVKMLQVEQIAKRLDDRFRLLVSGSRTALPRQQTLRALIDWSYNLLPAAEQRLLRWLSVFAGSFTLDAAEALCAEKNEGDALELLAQLVNKSLVVVNREPGREARYHLLETIRQYAGAKLEEYGEARLARIRHLAFFLQLVETVELRLHSAEQIVWFDLLETEYDNLRAALAWSLENPNGDLESGLRLATALVEFWVMRSNIRESGRWLTMALEKRNDEAPRVQARLLLNAGWWWLEQGEGNPTALPFLQESLALYRQLGDKRGMAWSLRWLGTQALFSGELVASASLYAEGLSLAGEIDDKHLLIGLYGSMAFVALQTDDHNQVMELTEKGLNLAQESDRQMKFHMLDLRGRSASRQYDYARATTFFHQALALSRELKSKRDEHIILVALGEMARVQRDYEQAVLFQQESLTLAREMHSQYGVASALGNLGLIALAQGDWPQAALLFRESLVLVQEIKNKVAILWNVWGLAGTALAAQQTQRAVQLLAATEQLLEIDSIHPVDQENYERQVALSRAQLGEEAFAAAWAAGQAMSLEEVAAYALQAEPDLPFVE